MSKTKERPILFSAPMVRAILDGDKTVTRRVAKLTDSGRVKAVGSSHNWHTGDPEAYKACPYGQPGDRLWVRETWAIEGCGRRVSLDPRAWDDGWPVDRLRYIATDKSPAEQDDEGGAPYWWNSRPSIHMPRWASRINLEITNVGLERLNNLTVADAFSEGIIELDLGGCPAQFGTGRPDENMRDRPRPAFIALWESINGPGSWCDNPLVWVVQFRRAFP